ncbi:unnamed protein product [Didymodactylos carnosus]|uniref:Uncharacterized protein n=1 Tax=Didymodactylos carnosus TaxID=1234261 RepID=A0A8S2DW98_9BILA|nr:unnamed protein product [Didymodactylos carnosus]CAF3786662.1 unnamed protein product [Didymodactylos carnosus]
MFVKWQIKSIFTIIFYVISSLYALTDNETNDLTFSSKCPTCRRLFLLDSSGTEKQSLKQQQGFGSNVHSHRKLLKSKLYTEQERLELKQLKKEEKKNSKRLFKLYQQKRNPAQNKLNNTTRSAKQRLVKEKSMRSIRATNDVKNDRCHASSYVGDKKVSKTNNSTKSSTTSKQSKEHCSPLLSKRKDKREQQQHQEEDKSSRKKKLSKQKVATVSASEQIKEKKRNQQLNNHSSSIEFPFTQSTIQKKKEQETKISPTVQLPKEKLVVVNKEQLATDNEQSTSIEDDLEFFNGSSKNVNVVGRAYYFVKNMFQLADDNVENDKKESVFVSHNDALEDNERQEYNEIPHQKRKILSIIDDDLDAMVYNDFPAHNIDLNFHENNVINMDKVVNKQCMDQNLCDHQQLYDDLVDLSTIPKRRLLATQSSKISKHKKQKQNKTDTINMVSDEPQVAGQYRHRISPYIDAQQQSIVKQKNKRNKKKKSISQLTDQVCKEKLSTHDDIQNGGISSQCQLPIVKTDEKVNSVLITEGFVPKTTIIELDNLFMKRQLLAKQRVIREEQEDEETDDEEEINQDEEEEDNSLQQNTKEPLEPQDIVRSYENGLYKPRVGWQFRYRISRYIDSLRENIREDRERLKQGLKNIERKTTEEFSDRKNIRKTKVKSIDDKILKEETKEATVKPNVGFRYRYRVSKMLEAKRNGDYIDDAEEKRKARQKNNLEHNQDVLKKKDVNIESKNDMDQNLEKLKKEEKDVGWKYRYRIRQKLTELKRKYPAIPISNDAPGRERLKKTVVKKSNSDQQPKDQENKNVGWNYRYRVSKMLEEQKHEKTDGKTLTKPKLKLKAKVVNEKEELVPDLSNLTPEQKVVGWAYRYRIRRKLDAIRNETLRTIGGKRLKNKKSSNDTITATTTHETIQKTKQKQSQIKKFVNTDDRKETMLFSKPFNYVIYDRLPAFRNSICRLLIRLPFCGDTDDETSRQKDDPKPQVQKKKLKTKKEQRAKQFIRTKASKLVSDDDNDKPIDETLKKYMKNRTTTTSSKKSTKTRVSKHHIVDDDISITQPKRKKSSHRRRVIIDERVQYYDGEESPVKKVISIETNKKNMKKKFHVIEKEIKSAQRQNGMRTAVEALSGVESTKHASRKSKKKNKIPIESNNNILETSKTTSKKNLTKIKTPIRDNLKLSDIVDRRKDAIVETTVYNPTEKIKDRGINQPIIETVTEEEKSFLKHSNDDDRSSEKSQKEVHEINDDVQENLKLNQQKMQTDDDDKEYQITDDSDDRRP